MSEFPFNWYLPRQEEDPLVINQDIIERTFGKERIVLRERAESAEAEELMLRRGELIDGETWFVRKLAKAMEYAYFPYLGHNHAATLINRLAQIEGLDLVGYSEQDMSITINPSGADIPMRGKIG